MRVISYFAALLCCISIALAQDPLKIDPAHYKVEFENARVRVLRIKYGPHEKSPMHEHPDGVAIFLTPDQSTDTLPDGTTHSSNWKAGEATWTSAGKHAPDNTSDKPLELILVELKGGTGEGSEIINEDKNSERAKLVALTNEWTDAINSGNRQKLDVLMAPDFALYHWNGKLAAPRLQWLDNLFNHIKITKNTLTDASPQIYGDSGVVTSVGDWIGTFDGNPFASKCVVADTWRKIDSQWKVIRRTSRCYAEDSVSAKLDWKF